MKNIQQILDISKKVMLAEGQAIVSIAHELHANGFVAAVEMLLQCSGHVILSGVGKSGHIGKKLASSLASTGTPSFFIHPAEAKHGDLGMITAQDIVVAISYSGESEELLSLIPFIRHKGVQIILMTGNKDSTLAKKVDHSIIIQIEKEACPHNLAPTVSTSVTLAIGDAIAITLMELKQFSRQDFSKNHPAGKLGKILLMTINDVMSKLEDLPMVKANDSLIHAINIITEKRLGFTAVVDEQLKPIGIVTDGDLRRTLLTHSDIKGITVAQIMTHHPKTIKNNTLVVDATKYLQQNKITSLLVVDEQQKLVGATHIHDLMQFE